MRFKEGSNWKACHDEERGLYTAETWWRGSYDLYEIDESIFEKLGSSVTDAREASRLIHLGRHLYMSVSDSYSPPYDVILDEDYKELCPWADVQMTGETWGPELTDIAVELFDSEKANREQRRKKREQREKNRK